MVEWRITQFNKDCMGNKVGDSYQTVCYTLELMQSYQDPSFVEKIEQYIGGRWKVVWTPDMPVNTDALERKYRDFTATRW